MAFIDQVQDLTSLTVSDNDELSQFLKDGVLDVTNRWLAVKPQDVEFFSRESAETTSNTSSPLDLNGAKIISVIRENGTNDQWRNCRKIAPADQYNVTDEESLSYASKYNPVYMVGDNGEINVFPVPGVTTDAFKVYYVNNVPVDKGGAALIHSHSDIGYFADDKVYLVVIYAGIRLLQATMGSNVISLNSVPPDVPTLATVSFSETNALSITASVPDTPSDPSISSPGVATVTLGSLGTAPTLTSSTLTSRVSFNDFFESGSLNPLDDSDPSALSVTAVSPDTPTLTSITFSSIGSDLDASLPTYTTATVSVGGALGSTALPEYSKPTISNDVQSNITTFIDTDEDVELAQAKIQQFQASLGEYQADIQNELNEFNKENVQYQASVQEALQELQVANQVNIAAAQGELQKNIDNENRSQQRQLQNSINTMQAIMQDNQSLIQKYQAELGVYQAEVGSQVQEYTQKLQRYTLELNTVYQAWQKTESDSLQQYQLDIQANLNEFNEDNVIYQSTVQEAIQNATIAATEAQKEGDLTLQATIQDYTQELSLFGGEIQKYQAEVNKEVQEYTTQLQSDVQTMQGTVANNQALLTKYQSETAEYQAETAAETQEQTVKMQHYQLLYSQLKAEYDQAFMIAAPQEQVEA